MASSSTAAAAYKAGDFDAAAEAYSAVLEAAADADARAAALTNRAQCYMRLGRFQDGREDAAAARALAPANPKAWYRLGCCEARLSRLAEAEEALAEAAKLRPCDTDIRNALLAVKRRQTEARGQYAWKDIYSKYLHKDPGSTAATSTPAEIDDTAFGVLATLGVEPFVGPVRIRLSETRGRGLFVTEDVPAGRLLLCAQALVTGKEDELARSLLASVRRSTDIWDTVFSLSHGTPASEASLPVLSETQLAAPRRLLSDDAADNADKGKPEDLADVLYFNQFGLPTVNPNAAPIEIGNDPERSGLWLLPAFINHSCRPNVQTVIVRDCLFMRASRDLRAGDELFNCYIETLQPLARRRAALATYGIEACCCERCLLEEAVLDIDEVQEVLEQAVAAKSAGEAEAIAEKAELAATQADVVVGRALETCLAKGGVPRACAEKLQLPDGAGIPAERMALLREGIEKCTDSREEENFKRQEALHCLLLGSFANVLRSFAVSLKGLKRYVDASFAWSRTADALEQVIPCSELATIVCCEAFSNKLLAFHLDYKKTCREAFHRNLLASHRAYGGGDKAWRTLSEQTFAAAVLDGSKAIWAALKKDHGIDDDGYEAEEFQPSSVANKADTGPSFEDLLRRKARSRFCFDKKPEGKSTVSNAADAGIAHSSPSTHGQSELVREATADAPAATNSASEPSPVVAPAECSKPQSGPEAASYEVVSSKLGEVSVVFTLPGLSSATETSLEVAERVIRVRSLRPDVPHSLDVALPHEVDPASSAAKWSKRAHQLTVKLTTVKAGGENNMQYGPCTAVDRAVSLAGFS